MTPPALVAVTEVEGRRVLDAACHDLGAAVPSCPGWSVADVLSHTASIYRRTTHVLVNGLTERPAGSDWYAEAPEGKAVLGWFEQALDDLVDQLAGVDPGRPAWTFSVDDRTAGFWCRRMAHETLMHRVDVEAARGPISPIDPAVAADGIDEALQVLIRPGLAGRHCGDEVTVHLDATDVAGGWVLELGPEGIIASTGTTTADASLRGPAAGVLLWLWGRAGTQGLDHLGDAEPLLRLRDLVATVT